MTLGWKDNALEGRYLRRAVKRLTKKLETANTTSEICELSRCLAYVAGQKAALVKMEWDKEIEERLEELERIAGIAKKGKISR